MLEALIYYPRTQVLGHLIYYPRTQELGPFIYYPRTQVLDYLNYYPRTQVLRPLIYYPRTRKLGHIIYYPGTLCRLLLLHVLFDFIATIAANLSVKDVLFVCESSFILPIGENLIVFVPCSSTFGIAFDSAVFLSTSSVLCSGVSSSTSVTSALSFLQIFPQSSDPC